MKKKSFRTNQKIQIFKNCILILSLIFIASCGFKIVPNTPECFGIGGLEEIPPNFWSDCKSVLVTARMEKNIDAERAGGESKSKPTNFLPVGMLAYHLTLLGGVILNPALIMGVPLGIDGATGIGNSTDSPEFNKNINKTISKEKIFFDLIKQELTFPTVAQPSYKMETLEKSGWLSLIGIERKAEIESDTYVTVTVKLIMLPDSTQEDPEAKAKMMARTTMLVETKDAWQRHADLYQELSPHQDKILGKGCSGIQQEKIFQSTYIATVNNNTEAFAHSKWLSDDGNFLKEKIKQLLQRSLIELTQKVGRDRRP